MTEEIIEEAEVVSTSLTVRTPEGTQLAPIEQLGTALVATDERRTLIRQWVKSKFKRGTHYGFPPGLEPKMSQDGLSYRVKGSTVRVDQYAPKESLYGPGAQMVADNYGWKAHYDIDMDSWKMGGEKVGSFFYVCRLVDSNGDYVAMSRGTASAYKQGDREFNTAVKMAQKRAFVGAVISGACIQDMFTQDLEDNNSNPSTPKDFDSPNVKGRAERQPTDNTLSGLQKLIKECFEAYRAKKTEAKWLDFAATATAWVKEDLSKPENWTDDICQRVMIRIDEMQVSDD